MSAIALIERLRRLDVRVWFAGDRLRLNAPAGVLTPELQAEIAKYKTELRALIAEAQESDAVPITPVDRQGRLPLSPTQQRMWVLHRIDPAGATYHIVHSDRLRGPLDVAVLEQAWQALVHRQESLRTRIVESKDGVPSIAIDAHAVAPIRIEDLSALDAHAREAALGGLTDAEAHRPFDLARGPLAELILVRMAAGDHVLLVRLHHIISDQWSLGVLRQELAALYREAITSAPASLAPLSIQYVDHAAWIDARAVRPEREAHLAYWRAQLQDLEPLELPSLNPRRPVTTPDGDRLTMTLPAGLLDRLSAVATRAGATLFMSLLAAYGAVLHRYTGRSDFAIGTPVAGRGRVELEELIGAFINTLALRVSVRPDLRFVDLLAALRHTTLDAYAHQEIPFEQLVAALAPARRAGQSPLVQVMFNFLNTPRASLDLPGIAVESTTVDRRAAAFDLTVIVDAAQGTVTAEFRPEVIPAAGIRLFLAHYVHALEAVSADPEQPIGVLPILGAEERAAIGAINTTSATYDHDRGAEQMIAEQAHRTPDAVAVRCGDAVVSYRELDLRASTLADRLRARGVGPEVLVGICLSRSELLPVALLAVMKAGGAYLPLDPDLPASRLAWMISNSGTRLVLSEAATAGALTSFDGDVLRLDQALSPDVRRNVSDHRLEPHGDHLAYVLYTSGSTGQPKGVQIPRRALANFVRTMRDTLGISSNDVLVAVTTLSFDIAALEIFVPLTIGATVVIASRDEVVDGRRLLGLAAGSGATMMQATPTTWRLLIEAGWTGTPPLKVLVGGEALPPDLADALVGRASDVWNLYGPTETTIWSTAERVTSNTRVIGIGAPIANTEVYVLDASMQLAPIGVPGELYIGGDGVARGYLGRPDLTASRFVPDPFSGRSGARLYRTGDRVRLRPEGRLEYLGRLDTQVKLRGFRIETGEIEAALSDQSAVGHAVVIVQGDGDAARLVAYVTRRSETAVDEALLRAYLRERLPAYMVPSTFIELAALPLTPNGKIDRNALLSSSADASTREQRVVAPRTETEQTLARVWCDLLNVGRVGVGDDFFALGGHSLMAMRLVAQIHHVFHVSLAPGVLFVHSTLESLAEQIDAARAPDAAKRAAKPILVPLQRGGAGKPFFWVHGIGGEVFSYMQVSRHLAAARPVFGFAADWSQLADNQPLTLERIAERYIRELRAAHPEGPYHFGGYCSAALLAFEMARQLEAAGAEVGLVVALDYPAAPPQAELSRVRTLRAFARNLPRWWREDARQSTSREMVGRVQSALRRTVARVASRARDAGDSVEHPIDLRDQLSMWRFPDHQVPMLHAHHQALSSYRLKPCRVRVAVFLPNATPLLGPFREQYACGWHSCAIGGVDEDLVPGSHTTMLMDPFARELAHRLETSLQQTEQDLRGITEARSA